MLDSLSAFNVLRLPMLRNEYIKKKKEEKKKHAFKLQCGELEVRVLSLWVLCVRNTQSLEGRWRGQGKPVFPICPMRSSAHPKGVPPCRYSLSSGSNRNSPFCPSSQDAKHSIQGCSSYFLETHNYFSEGRREIDEKLEDRKRKLHDERLTRDCPDGEVGFRWLCLVCRTSNRGSSRSLYMAYQF